MLAVPTQPKDWQSTAKASGAVFARRGLANPRHKIASLSKQI